MVDKERGGCIVIDPGSKDMDNVLDYLAQNNLSADYILLTHEHFDHCWGVNSIKNAANAKVVSTRACKDWIKIPMNYFNKLYYDSDESFSIENVDIIVEDIGMALKWNDIPIRFIESKGHTDKGICIYIENFLFSGDTMIKDTKPVLKKKYGASKYELEKTIELIYSMFSPQTLVYPGHGEPFLLKEMQEFYVNYFANK